MDSESGEPLDSAAAAGIAAGAAIFVLGMMIATYATVKHFHDRRKGRQDDALGIQPSPRRGVKKVPKDLASLTRGGPGYALLTEASRAAGVRLAFADF